MEAFGDDARVLMQRAVFHSSYPEPRQLPQIPGAEQMPELREMEDVMRLIAANTRAPYVVLGDISGQIGVTRIGRQHMHEMCDRFGARTVVESMEAMIASSGAEFRAGTPSM